MLLCRRTHAAVMNLTRTEVLIAAEWRVLVLAESKFSHYPRFGVAGRIAEEINIVVLDPARVSATR